MPSTRDFMSSSMRRTSGCSMIATRGAVASFHCAIDEPCLRSFAYSSAFRYAADATLTLCTPTAMRAPFIMRNICAMPRFSTVPTSSPMQSPFSPKFRTAVDDPLMPILCSMLPVATSLETSEPSAANRFFGTMNSESPLVPGGAPFTRASTMWTMFSVMS